VKNFLIGCGILAGLVAAALIIGAVSNGIRSYYIHNVNAYTLSVSTYHAPAYSNKITRIHVVGTNEKGEEVTYDKTYTPPVYAADTEALLWKGTIQVQVWFDDGGYSFPCTMSAVNESGELDRRILIYDDMSCR
jgi:hypothetical protein